MVGEVEWEWGWHGTGSPPFSLVGVLLYARKSEFRVTNHVELVELTTFLLQVRKARWMCLLDVSVVAVSIVSTTT